MHTYCTHTPYTLMSIYTPFIHYAHMRHTLCTHARTPCALQGQLMASFYIAILVSMAISANTACTHTLYTLYTHAPCTHTPYTLISIYTSCAYTIYYAHIYIHHTHTPCTLQGQLMASFYIAILVSMAISAEIYTEFLYVCERG